MARRFFLATILLLGYARSMAQIEKLTTIDEVLQFVRKVAPGYGPISSKIGFRLTTHAAADSLFKIYHLQSFEKADLDGNGLTDLIFNGSQHSGSSAEPLSLAILSFGHDSFYIRNLSLDLFEDIAAHPLFLDGKPYLQTIRVNQDRHAGYRAEYHIDTLAWQYNAFIEKKPPVKRKITQIDYNAWNGLAFYTNITLRIANDSVRLIKEKLEGFSGLEGGGVYLARLDPNTDQRLYGLLEAMDFARLKDSFHVDGFDATTGTLRITYDNGQTKTITDYGTCGTYGLAELHRLLYGLTETQYWVNADPVMPRSIDSLHSDREVLGLIRTLYEDYPFVDFEPDTTVKALPDYQQRLAAFDEPRWQKADIDGNGYMDLLFNGYLNKDGQSRQCTIVVLSFGADSLLKHEISGANGFFAARLIRYNGQNDIQIHYREAIEDSAQEKGYRLLDREDTLTAFDGRIVELPAPALHHIEKLNVREEGGDDSVAVMGDTIRWYKNEADPPARKDSINLYLLVDAKTCQKLLTLAAGIRFERLNPDLLLPNKLMRYFSSTWYIEHDGGKQSQFTSDGLIGSYRLQALGNYLWELKRYRNDWKLVSPVHIQQSIR